MLLGTLHHWDSCRVRGQRKSKATERDGYIRTGNTELFENSGIGAHIAGDSLIEKQRHDLW